MQPLATLGLFGSPFQPGDGATGFWITLWPPTTSVLVIILCGAFCAHWARSTGRSAWLWFFLGVTFNIITLACLLYLNAQDRKSATEDNKVPSQPTS